jgi:FKBP-type peptidyl-prolyl cis-trans isomerase FkpA
LREKGEMIKTMRKTIYAVALTALAINIVACNPAKKYEEEEKSLIADYVATNNITVAPDANGIYYIESEPGTGDLITVGDSVGVWYTGMFLTEEEFDSNVEKTTPFRFIVGAYYLIDGWSKTLVKMRLGSKARILMPSKMAYGPTGFSTWDSYGYYYTIIPGYTPLLFDLEVVELTRAARK